MYYHIHYFGRKGRFAVPWIAAHKGIRCCVCGARAPRSMHAAANAHSTSQFLISLSLSLQRPSSLLSDASGRAQSSMGPSLHH